jgi:hypothetical protein
LQSNENRFSTTGISRRQSADVSALQSSIPASIALPESTLMEIFHCLKLNQKGIEVIDEKSVLLKRLSILSLTGNNLSKIERKYLPKNIKSLYLDCNLQVSKIECIDPLLSYRLALDLNRFLISVIEINWSIWDCLGIKSTGIKAPSTSVLYTWFHWI